MNIDILLRLIMNYVTPEIKEFLSDRIKELHNLTKKTPNGVDDILTENLAKLLGIDLNE